MPRSPWLWWGVLAVALTGVLTYANAIGGDFVFDDVKLIVNNDVLKSASRVRDVLFSNVWGTLGRESNYYRPLPPLTFMALHGLFGLRPAPFHVVNVLLHAGTAVLVFLLARRLLRRDGACEDGTAEWPALAAGILFAVHPLHTEAVAWISGVMDVACAFFSLLAVWAYVRTDDGPRAAAWRGIAVVALFLALLSKEPAAAVPVLFVVHDLLFRRARVAGVRAMLRRWGPALLVFAVYLALRVIALRGVAPLTAEVAPSLANVPALLFRYVAKLVVPVGLNVVHQVPPATSFVAAPVVAGLAIAALGIAAGAWAARREPAAPFALALFIVPLAPALHVGALAQEASKAFAERYAYFPSAGAAVLVAVLLARLSRPRAARVVALAAVLVVASVFFVMTVARNRVWHDSYALWSDSVRKNPGVAMAHENLGLALMRRGQPDAARRELQMALQLDPELPARWMTSGVLAARSGQFLQAILAFQTALAYQPDLVEARYNLAVAFESRAWTDLAIGEYRAVLARDAMHANAHNNLGILLAERRQLDEAIAHFETALRARPNDGEIQMNLAHALRMRAGR